MIISTLLAKDFNLALSRVYLYKPTTILNLFFQEPLSEIPK